VGKRNLPALGWKQNTAKTGRKTLEIAVICAYGNAAKVNENYPPRAGGCVLTGVQSLCKTPIFFGLCTAAEGKPESRFFCFGGFLTI